MNVYVPVKHLLAAAAAAAAGSAEEAGRPQQLRAAPTLEPSAPLPKLPVMVYFPAGQFMWGSGNDAENFIAPQTAAGEQVIVVTMNYRLGAAGYLALDELKARDPAGSVGNYGSLDQRAVLKWVRQNIEGFGGDARNTVLWGESAGAAAVTAHLVMPKSWPYFDKAIIESGAFNGWSYKTRSDATANAKVLASNLNCTYYDNSNSSSSRSSRRSNAHLLGVEESAVGAVETHINVSCLLAVSIEKLSVMDDDAERAGSPKYAMPFADRIDKSLWAPVIDGVEMVGIPAELLRLGKQAPVPILLGTNRDEGSTFTYNQSGHGDGNLPINGTLPDMVSMYSENLFSYQQMLPAHGHRHPSKPQSFSTGLFVNRSELECWVRAVFGANASGAVDTIVSLYHPVCVGGPNGTCGSPVPAGPAFNARGITSWWWSLSRLIGDWVLSCPARRAVKLLLSSSPANRSQQVFVYHFNHTPTFSLNEDSTDLYGAFHGSEVPFVFYDTLELAEKSELALSEAMVQYWVGFAYHGDPNIPPPGMVGGIEELPTFPAASADNITMIFGDTADGHTGFANISSYTALKRVECDFWDALASSIS